MTIGDVMPREYGKRWVLVREGIPVGSFAEKENRDDAIKEYGGLAGEMMEETRQ